MPDGLLGLDIVAGPSHDYELPSYRDVGWIIVAIYGKCEPYADGSPSVYTWEHDIVDYASDSCVFWISEGEGFDYWIDQIDFPGPGVYTIHNITGTYYRGDGYTTDDDVEWEHDDPIPARWSHVPGPGLPFIPLLAWMLGIDMRLKFSDLPRLL